MTTPTTLQVIINYATGETMDLLVESRTNAGMEQINVYAADTKRRALLTRFSGSRLWSVRGRWDDSSLSYTEHLHDGEKEKFLKGTALELAGLFVARGRTFL